VRKADLAFGSVRRDTAQGRRSAEIRSAPQCKLAIHAPSRLDLEETESESDFFNAPDGGSCRIDNRHWSRSRAGELCPRFGDANSPGGGTKRAWRCADRAPNQEPTFDAMRPMLAR
jgi:hypothetical protein